MSKVRKYIKSTEVKELAERVFEENGRGFTIEDVVKTFEVRKKKAQRMVKHLHGKKILFTANDLEKENIRINGIRRQRPQRYYYLSSKTKLVERLKNNNVLKDATGYIDSLGDHKAQNFSQALALLGPLLLFIHKLQLWTTIDLQKFNPFEESNLLPRSFTERIGVYDVKYEIYLNGSVMIYVISSNQPFRLYNEQDVIDILAFLGKAEDRLRTILSDPRGRIVLPVSKWVLKCCDVNKDVKISSVAQVTLPDLQIPFVDKAFRAYVKPMDEDVVYRVEWSLVPDKPMREALADIRNDVKIDKDSLIECFSI